MPMIERFNPVKNPSLYTLTAELQDAIADYWIDEETGEIHGQENIEALAIDTQEKVLNCARAVKNMAILLEALKKQKKELDSRIRTTERISEAIKARCIEAMQTLDMKSIKDVDIAITARKGESLQIEDESQIAPEFWTEKVTRTIDKRGLKEAIKAGADMQGVRLVPSYSLMIRG